MFKSRSVVGNKENLRVEPNNVVEPKNDQNEEMKKERTDRLIVNFFSHVIDAYGGYKTGLPNEKYYKKGEE